MTCQPLVISHDSASVSTIDRLLIVHMSFSTVVSSITKYLVIDYVQWYINPPVAPWIEPTCPLGSHPGVYNSVSLFSLNLTCPLGSHPCYVTVGTFTRRGLSRSPRH